MKPYLSVVGFNPWTDWVLFWKPFPTPMLHRELPMEYMTPYPKAKAIGCPTSTHILVALSVFNGGE